MKPAGQHPSFPEWFPLWASELSELFFSGSTSQFVLHGNVQDSMPLTADGSSYGSLSEFLAEQVFGRWDLVLHYDLARGLRAFAGRDGTRLKVMVARANEKGGTVVTCICPIGKNDHDPSTEPVARPVGG